MSRESTATPGGSAASPGDASHTGPEAPPAAEGAALSGQPWTLRVRGKEKRVRSLRATLRNPWVWVATVAALATGFAGRSAYDMLFNTDRQAYVDALLQARRAAGQEQAARAIQGQGSMLSAPPNGVRSAAPPAGATPASIPAPVVAGAVTNGTAGAMPAEGAPAQGSTAGSAQAGAPVGLPAAAGASSVAPALAASPGAASPGMAAPPGQAAQSAMVAGATAALAVPPATTPTVDAAASGLVPDSAGQRTDGTARDARRRHGSAQSRVTANRRALFAPPPGIEPTPYGVGAGLIAPGQAAYTPGQGTAGDNANAAARPAHKPQRERETLSPRERQQLAQRRHQPSSTNPGVIDAIKNIFQDISSRHVVPLRPEDKTRP